MKDEIKSITDRAALEANQLLGFDRLSEKREQVEARQNRDDGDLLRSAGRILNKAGTESIN